MEGFLTVLLISTAYMKFCTSCPAQSCSMCSLDITICNKLSSIIVVPETTKALMLTDGRITLVDNSSLSDLSNMTLLGLSNNAILGIMENAFQDLKHLRILLLDHNHITSVSIPDSAFIQLQSLEMLQLGNNALKGINGSWFQGMRNLLTLQLEGNLITKLPAGTFKSASLDKLESLDLSDNLIDFLAKGSFHGLPQLRRLDLSRNRLRSTPDAFSYLTWLSALNLDYNQWNCTCELQELASFLSSYMQAPDKVLYNGRKLVCVSSANPAVQTVLQLTEANCVPPNENITVLVKAGGGVGLERYARDVSLAACLFFAGGVGLTVAALYIIYCKMEKRSLRSWRERSLAALEAGGTGAILQSRGSPQCRFTEDSNVQILTITHPGQDAKAAFPQQKRQLAFEPVARERALPHTEHCSPCYRCSPPAAMLREHVWADAGGSFSPTLASEAGLKPNRDYRVQNQYERSKIEHHVLNNQERFVYQRQNAGLSEEKDFVGHLSTYHWDKSTQSLLNSKRATGGSYRYPEDNSLRSKVQSIQTLPECPAVSCVHHQKPYEYRLLGNQNRSRREDSAAQPHLTERPSSMVTKLYRESNLRNMNSLVDLQGPEHQQRRTGLHLQPQRNVTFNLTDPDICVLTLPNKKKRQDQPESQGPILWPPNNKTPKDERWVIQDWTNKQDLNNSLLKVKLNLNPLKKSRVHPIHKKELPTGQKALGRTERHKKTRNIKKEADLCPETREPGPRPKVQKDNRNKPATGQEAYDKVPSQTHHLRNRPRPKGKSARLKDGMEITRGGDPESSKKLAVDIQKSETEVKHPLNNIHGQEALSVRNTVGCQTHPMSEGEGDGAGVFSAQSKKREMSEDAVQEVSASETHYAAPLGVEEIPNGHRETPTEFVKGPCEDEGELEQFLSPDLTQRHSSGPHTPPENPSQSYSNVNSTDRADDQEKEHMGEDPDQAFRALNLLPQEEHTDTSANQEAAESTDMRTLGATGVSDKDENRDSIVMDNTQSDGLLEPESMEPAALSKAETESRAVPLETEGTDAVSESL